ncbi:TetR/AcrR family transcriptional regulator [Sphaerisporangium sp. NPDC051011]|uniref:TetR/AcrR family transcriptional regulator n=1 Tax=Sphaerisporangium sp. NPDC051011 TaxID=3155792 RepID=UPI003402AFED
MTQEWRHAFEDFEGHLLKLDWSNQTPSRRGILQAFLRLAIEHGFNSVSMRMIAREVKVKAPSLYAHFPDGRDEIVAESLRWHFYRFGMAIVEDVKEVTDPREAWRRMVRVHVIRQLTLPESNLWDLLVATDRMARFLPSSLREEADAWVDLYEALYRAAAADMGHESPARAVKFAMTILEGASRWAAWDGRRDSLDERVEEATTCTLALLWPGPASGRQRLRRGRAARARPERGVVEPAAGSEPDSRPPIQGDM